jgi:hypothetical protein
MEGTKHTCKSTNAVSKIGLITIFCFITISATAQNKQPSSIQETLKPTVETTVKKDRTTTQLRNIPESGRTGQDTIEEAQPVRLVRPYIPNRPQTESTQPITNILFQNSPGLPTTVEFREFSGIGMGMKNANSDIPDFKPRSAPPDTNGAAGGPIYSDLEKRNKVSDGHYVQWINSSFAVFEKSTGRVLYGPSDGKSLWRGFGGKCETNNDGDPLVHYDKLTNRWILSQFAVKGAGNGEPFYQCLAVSDTSDALGRYTRYSFKYTDMNDYPKMGVWPDGYYMTYNMFNDNGFVGAKVCAFDRQALLGLVTRDVKQICFQLQPKYGSFLPSDLDGTSLPAEGSPNYLLALDTDSVSLWKFKVDWQKWEDSQLSGPQYIKLGNFDIDCLGRGCVPQRGTRQRLDTLADRLMYRLAYRRFKDYESLTFNHTVSSGDNVTAIRWYELRNPNSSPAIFQGATFAPDSNHRWMGSIAMDRLGNIGLAYSVSGTELFPSIRFAGREFNDPKGKLQAEVKIYDGTGAQRCILSDGTCVCKNPDGTCQTLSRWGDYSSLNLDPDDCTMWYTTQYIAADGAYNWNTRIAAIRFKSCTIK